MENGLKALAIVLVLLFGFLIYTMVSNPGYAGGPTPTPGAEVPPYFASDVPLQQFATSTNQVVILYSTFSPDAISISPGTTVTWENQDGVIHSITSRPDSPVQFRSGSIGGRQVWSFTFQTPGRYVYYDDTTRQAQGVVYVT